jgi:hypothetical protein
MPNHMRTEVLVWARERSIFISTFSSECPHKQWCHVTVMPTSAKNRTDAVVKKGLHVHYTQVGTRHLWKCLTMQPNLPTTSHCGPFSSHPVHISTECSWHRLMPPFMQWPHQGCKAPSHMCSLHTHHSESTKSWTDSATSIHVLDCTVHYSRTAMSRH